MYFNSHDGQLVDVKISLSSTIYELTSNRNFRKNVIRYFFAAGAILFSPFFFITMKFQRNFSDFDEYGFPTTSFPSCGGEREDSSSTRMKKYMSLDIY